MDGHACAPCTAGPAGLAYFAAYTRWWKAIAEPSFIAGLQQTCTSDRTDYTSNIDTTTSSDCAGGVAFEQEEDNGHADAVRVAGIAFERCHTMRMQAGPLPTVCDDSFVWLEGVRAFDLT